MAQILFIALLDPAVLRLISRLQTAGHVCVVAGDASGAKLLFKRVAFDLVFIAEDAADEVLQTLGLRSKSEAERSPACFSLALRGAELPSIRPIGSCEPSRSALHGLEAFFVLDDSGHGVRGLQEDGLHSAPSSDDAVDYPDPAASGLGSLDQRQLAHDIKNLLTIVCASARSAASRVANSVSNSADSRTSDDLAELNIASERAVSLMRRWLASERRPRWTPITQNDEHEQSGVSTTGDTEPKCHDLRRLVSDVEPLLRRCLQPGIQLGLRAATRLPRVCVDVGEFERVLINLVLNANEALPKGGHVDIDIDLARPTRGLDASESQVGTQTFVRMTVADDGIGMAPDVARRIFEPSFTTKGARGGSGLGLSAVRSIVEGCRGVVEVDTRPGDGTRLTVYLPAVGPAKQESGPRPITGRFRSLGLSPTRSEAPAPKSLKTVAERPRKILVVDDEAPLRHLIVELLRGRGYEVLQAPDGVAALRLTSSLPRLDLLICDIRMPGRPGWEVARELSDQCGQLPVLFTSGHAEASFRQERAQLAHAEFLAKPFRMETLLGRVRQILDVGRKPPLPPSRLAAARPR